MSNLEQTHNLNMKIRDALGNIPNTKVGDDWFTCDDFPNQEINNFALEFFVRSQRYRVSVRKVDSSEYEEVA